MPRKRRAKPAVAVAEPQDFGGMAFPDIGTSEPEDKPATSEHDSLKRELEELRAQNARFQEDLARVTAAPAVVVAPTPPKPMSYDGLPDPMTDGTAFAQALSQRIRDDIEANRRFAEQGQNQTADRERKIETLWDDFENAYPELAKDREGLEFVTMQVAKKAKNRGADLDRYMFVTQEKFMSDVVKAYDRVFGESDDDSEPEPAPRRRAARQRDTDEPTRTSVFGGLEGGGRPSGTPRDPPASESSMVKELQDMQLSSGFYGTPPRKS